MQVKDQITEDLRSSPTASLPLIIMVAAIAASDQRHVRTVDVGCAYYMEVDDKLCHTASS